MEAFNWSFLLLVCLVASGCAVSYWLGGRKGIRFCYDRLGRFQEQELKAENALLQYERGEMVRKLEEMDGRLRMSENENRLLRRRVVVLEDLVAVRDVQLKMERLGKDPVIGKCEEALEKLKGSSA